uniref:Anoctamin n=1 Tax=Lepisosteus oculatus TaxID=7918 RepID=W5MHZ7_LEPOC
DGGPLPVCVLQIDGQHQSKDSVFFRDGVRRIDFVLSYLDDHTKDGEKKQERRKEYESNLQKAGLELETEDKSESEDGKTYFLKVHAPWEVLATYAEVLKIKVPFKQNDIPNSREIPLQWLFKPFRLPDEVMNPEPDYFTSPFEKDKPDFFLIDNKDTFFPPSTRNRIVYYILSRCPYWKEDMRDKKGIKRLLSNGTYTSAYALHDCRYWTRANDLNCESERFTLYKEWARFLRFYKEQPLNLIRKYYGEKIGIYFAWLGFYTEMLFFAAIVGLICFCYGASTYHENEPGDRLADAEGHEILSTMCPLTWSFIQSLPPRNQSHLFDNVGTLFFAIFMGIWEITIHFTLISYKWSRSEDLVPDYEEEWVLDRSTLDFCGKMMLCWATVILWEMEPYLPLTSKCARFCLSGATVIFWIALIIACIIGVIAYRLAVYAAFASLMKDNPAHELQLVGSLITPQMATSVTASCINFVIIMILNFLYERVAIWITDMEIPRTHLEYENRLTMKMFLFQFVNYYSSCFYVAFFKGKFVGYPGKYIYMFAKWRNEECDPGGCLIELTTQLVIVMAGKQVWGNIQEALVPLTRNSHFPKRIRRCRTGLATCEMFHEMVQLTSSVLLLSSSPNAVIQFGFITLFVASFPLAPLLALVNNIIEIRVDAWKFTTQFRRPVAAKAHSIGAWQEILNGIAIVSVVTNAFIVSFTSDMIPRLVYYYQYSSNYSMEGYINNSLSIFNISQFSDQNRPENGENPIWFNETVDTTCRYRDFRFPPGHEKEYSHNMQFWHVIAAKLAFIIPGQHVVFMVKFFVAWLIPDVPTDVKARVKRERYLIQEYLHNYELERLKNQLSQQANGRGCPDPGGLLAATEKHEVLSQVL